MLSFLQEPKCVFRCSEHVEVLRMRFISSVFVDIIYDALDHFHIQAFCAFVLEFRRIDSYVISCFFLKSYKTTVFSQSKWRVAIFRWYLDCFFICNESTVWWQSSIFVFFCVFGVHFVLLFDMFAVQNHIRVLFIIALTTFSVLPQFSPRFLKYIDSFFYFGHSALSHIVVAGTRAFMLSSRQRFNAWRTALSPTRVKQRSIKRNRRSSSGASSAKKIKQRDIKCKRRSSDIASSAKENQVTQHLVQEKIKRRSIKCKRRSNDGVRDTFGIIPAPPQPSCPLVNLGPQGYIYIYICCNYNLHDITRVFVCQHSFENRYLQYSHFTCACMIWKRCMQNSISM